MRLDHYHIWVNLKDSRRDLEFADNLSRYLGHLEANGLIEGFHLARRKLGFGPDELGEFHVQIVARDLAQIEKAFGHVATRAGQVEQLHAAVFSMVTDFRSALYRDFPDAVRAR